MMSATQLLSACQREQRIMMQIGTIEQPFERLRQLCYLFKHGDLTEEEFVKFIRNEFNNGHGQDWVDEKRGLMKLALMVAKWGE